MKGERVILVNEIIAEIELLGVFQLFVVCDILFMKRLLFQQPQSWRALTKVEDFRGKSCEEGLRTGFSETSWLTQGKFFG